MASTVIGVGAAVNRLQAISAKSNAVLAIGVQRGCLQGQAIVRGNASGRPGPRVVTGDFRRSIAADTQVKGSTVLGQIGTNRPQGRRLEYGFTGTDALGRRYNQPPFPYLQPSVPEVEKAVREQIYEAIGKADL